MSRGRRATQPDVALDLEVKPRPQGSLVAILTLEDNPLFLFDLSGMAGPEGIRIQMGMAVAAWSSNENGGRRVETVKSMRRSLSSFLRWLDVWNKHDYDNEQATLASLADLTPFHLLQLKNHLQANHSRYTAFGYYRDITVLLRVARDVSPETRREALKRKGDEPGAAHRVERYSKEEFFEVKNAARRKFAAAHARITASYVLSQQAEDLTGEVAVRARALHEVILHGKPQTSEGMLALGARPRTVAHGGGESAARSHLFLSADEVFAAIVLLACQRGLNLSPILTAPVPVEHEPGLVQLDLDKPRRGSKHRFWQELFIDDAFSGIQDDRGANTLRMIVEATDPARDYLAAQGESVERLLVYWPNGSTGPKTGTPTWLTRNRSKWIPAGTTIDFRRLRRSIPGQGVSKEPTHHSTDMYLYYLRSDPQALMEIQEVAVLGIEKLAEQARASLEVRIATDLEANPDFDAVIVNCSDPLTRPDTGIACTTGFYSFLDCLRCKNAATVPRLLPRQIAARGVLEELRDSMGEAWERRFAGHYHRLVAVISRSTPAEREVAAVTASQHIPNIVRALRHEVPE